MVDFEHVLASWEVHSLFKVNMTVIFAAFSICCWIWQGFCWLGYYFINFIKKYIGSLFNNKMQMRNLTLCITTNF